mmetsp:Transcript_14990/g.45272  ORF Transcript_14990/g.45272 Transcript_14990/m.45272 type:complete len:392 (-) Transcript_14990:199-1374(-)
MAMNVSPRLASAGAFITQRGGQDAEPTPRTPGRAKSVREAGVAELEALVSGITQTSQATLLLKKKKEMREVVDSLAFMKDEYNARMDACHERQVEFERRQDEMKEQVLRFEKFIQENDAKWRRAEFKAKTERKALENKQGELEELQEELRRAERERRQVTAQLTGLTRFKDYLDHTVDSSDHEYAEILDLLNRYRTLEDANSDLMMQVQQGDSNMDDMRTDLQNMRSETQNSILVMNSEINQYQKRLDVKRRSNKQMLEHKEREEESVNDINRDTWQVIMAIRNLYIRCGATMRTRIPPIHWDQFISSDDRPIEHAELGQTLDSCLRVVRERIRDLISIVEDGDARRPEDDMGLDASYSTSQLNGEGGRPDSRGDAATKGGMSGSASRRGI